jgi:hypothetical protein
MSQQQITKEQQNGDRILDTLLIEAPSGPKRWSPCPKTPVTWWNTCQPIGPVRRQK